MGFGVVTAVLLLLLVLSALRKRQPAGTFSERTGPMMNELDIMNPRVVTDKVAPPMELPAIPADERVSDNNDDLHDSKRPDDGRWERKFPTTGQVSDQAADHTKEL